MQGHGQLDDAEIAGEVTPVLAHDFNDSLTDFCRELKELVLAEGSHILWAAQFRKNPGHVLNPFSERRAFGILADTRQITSIVAFYHEFREGSEP